MTWRSYPLELVREGSNRSVHRIDNGKSVPVPRHNEITAKKFIEQIGE